MSYSPSNRDNITKQTKWVSYSCEAGFFDIRYKGKKWTKEDISVDRIIYPQFKEWMMFNINNKDFDWIQFCQENDFDKLIYFIENTNQLDKRVIDFNDDCLYITSDGVLGIRFKRLEVRHTYDVDKKKAYREKYFMVNISDKNEYYHSSSIYHDAPKEPLLDYNLIDGVFIKKIK